MKMKIEETRAKQIIKEEVERYKSLRVLYEKKKQILSALNEMCDEACPCKEQPIEESAPLNESIQDILQQATSLLNDKTIVYVAGEAITKGNAIMAMLGTLGLPAVAAIAINVKPIIKRFGNIGNAIKGVFAAKPKEELTKQEPTKENPQQNPAITPTQPATPTAPSNSAATVQPGNTGV